MNRIIPQQENTPLIIADLNRVSNVGSDDQLNQLREEILYHYGKEKTVGMSNCGCWRGLQQLKSFEYVLENIKRLFKSTFNHYTSLDNTLSNYRNYEIHIHYWSNVNVPGSRNVLHSHNRGVLSGVYYVQSEGTGSLRLVNPANMLGMLNPMSPFSRDLFYQPMNKDLILWPSWIPHEVEPNLSDKLRINVAYDIQFVNPNQKTG